MWVISNTWSFMTVTRSSHAPFPVDGGKLRRSLAGMNQTIRRKCANSSKVSNSDTVLCCIYRYFIGTATDKPAVRHMYKVSTGAVGDVVCVTCGTFNADLKECTYNTIEFSTEMGYYVHGCDGPNAPRSVIKEAAVRQIE